MPTKKYVWYACYGSNLDEKRFLCYIDGKNRKIFGIPMTDKGCTDKTPPIKNIPFKIPYSLYFAKNSKKWGGAVAFIDHNENGVDYSFGRAWLITEEQFREVNKQEGKNYLKKIDLGHHENYPVKTFTNKNSMTNQILENNSPSEKYLNTIRRGLKKTYPKMKEEEIEVYLNRAKCRKHEVLR